MASILDIIAKVTEALQRAKVIVTLTLGFKPLLVQLVDGVEAAFPEGGQGRAKLEMVKAQAAIAFGVIDQAFVTFEQMWPTFVVIVEKIVEIRNATGAFKATPKPADVPA